MKLKEAIVLALVLAACGSQTPTTTGLTTIPTTIPTTTTPTTTAPLETTTTTEPITTTSTTIPESEFTRSEENAIESARDYLSLTSFSRTGLIEQLEYEGFTTEEATLAVDLLDADWNEQAWQSAESYLDFTSFSRSGLIEQLEYEGFTHEQAAYGVDKTGL